MIHTIYREWNPEKDDWDRYIVTIDEGNCETKTQIVPLKKKLFVLDYLKISFPRRERFYSTQLVIDAIPKEIVDKVYAFEEALFFSSILTPIYFPKDYEKGNGVAFIALLTEEDTGKPLPSRKLSKDRPIGISDEEWRKISTFI